MTIQALREYLQDAIDDIIKDSIEGFDDLDRKTKNQIRNAARLEAEKKAVAIVRYLNEFVHDKIDNIQGTVSDHESRLKELERRIASLGTSTL